MRIAVFCQSLLSDWNHGNAHFLRGVVAELLARGHDVQVYEPHDSWSLANLLKDAGPEAVEDFHEAYPRLSSTRYDYAGFDLDAAVADRDLILVHEWNDTAVVRDIGRLRRRYGYRLLFHDTHHRSVSSPKEMLQYDLRHYDGVLAFGDVIRRIYLRRGLTRRAWTWHEAADPRVFYPRRSATSAGHVVWIGNWGDDERSCELMEFLLQPVQRLGLRTRLYGVRYPRRALAALAKAGIEYGGRVPNHRAPEVFAEYRMTVHVPRRYYARQLPGIPTIRVFEALACGIPLICAPWSDRERLFDPGRDYLVARDGDEMQQQMKRVLDSPALAEDLAQHGLETIRRRHTCAHRVDQLMEICDEIGMNIRPSRRRVSERVRST